MSVGFLPCSWEHKVECSMLGMASLAYPTLRGQQDEGTKGCMSISSPDRTDVNCGGDGWIELLSLERDAFLYYRIVQCISLFEDKHASTPLIPVAALQIPVDYVLP